MGTVLEEASDVRQLDRVITGPLTIDLDSTICETYGLAKEGARHHGCGGLSECAGC